MHRPRLSEIKRSKKGIQPAIPKKATSEHLPQIKKIKKLKINN